MTVSSETKRSPCYACNGSVTNFSVPFYILDESHIAVYLITVATGEQAVLTLITDYTVNNVGVPAGSDIDTINTYSSAYEILILRAIPYTQLKDYIDHDTFLAESHEEGLDKLTMLLQQQQEELDRSIKFIETAEDSDVSIPSLDGQAGQALIVNETEDALDFSTPITSFDHNDSLNLQGGTTDEYYHLTAAQHTELNALVGARAILTNNGEYEGDILTVTVDDGSAVFSNALYCAADFHYERCDADAEATMPCRCLALESGAGSKNVLLEGQICNTSWTWTAGPIYVSCTTGELTQTAPSGSGDQVQIVGWALSATTIYFKPDATIVEIT